MRLLDKAYRLATTPGMAGKWVRWNLGSLGLAPSVQLPAGGRIFGFQDFSEYWTAHTILPSGDEIAGIDRHAGKSGVILDIGANVGTFALTLARLRPGCTIHAFEPSPANRANLENNLARNRQQNITPQPFAVGQAMGEAKFLEHPGSRRMSRLASAGETATASYDVKITTVDAFLESIGDPEVAFIKIDVEGFEADVLRGAHRTLTNRRCRAGLIELFAENFAQAASSTDDVINALKSCGFRLYFVNSNGSAGELVTAAKVQEAGLTNGLFLPE